MASEAAVPRVDKYEGLTRDDLLRAFRNMVTSRRIDDKEIQLKRQNRIFFQISGAGHEALQTAIAAHMKKGVDWLFPYYRDRALCLGLGVTPHEMFLEAVGAALGPRVRRPADAVALGLGAPERLHDVVADRLRMPSRHRRRRGGALPPPPRRRRDPRPGDGGRRRRRTRSSS